jgi:hypothetical protein
VIGDEGHWRGHQVKWNLAGAVGKVFQAKGLDAILERRASLKGAIDDCPLANLAAAVFPVERGVHQQIENKETLAALWRSPKDGKTYARDNPLDEIRGFPVDLNLVERHQLEALGSRRGRAIRHIVKWDIRGRIVAFSANGAGAAFRPYVAPVTPLTRGEFL